MNKFSITVSASNFKINSFSTGAVKKEEVYFSYFQIFQIYLGGNQMTVGKIYCAKLIYENYKHVKRSGRKNKMVSL